VKSYFRRWKSYSVRNTWFNPLVICIVIVSLYLALPEEYNPFGPALFLSYPLPPSADAASDAPIHYGKGPKDFAFVAFYTILLSFTREFIMQKVLYPFAVKVGLHTRGRQARFMEQAYTAMYFAILGPLGLYVMSKTPVWYFNTAGMYEGFPHMTHEGLFKGYYLLQASYWAQQMIVLLLMLEKPRPDFPQLVVHHFITLALIYLSYTFHFTYMGLAVYITHDISDFFLAVSSISERLDFVTLNVNRHPNSSTTCNRQSSSHTFSSSSRCGHTCATISIFASSPPSSRFHRHSRPL
jgi:acyl-CoA-dependent ceramide synthase